MKRSLAFVLGGLLLSATATAAADPDYLLLDLSAEALVHDGERLWARAIAAVVGDYTFFEQDDARDCIAVCPSHAIEMVPVSEAYG